MNKTARLKKLSRQLLATTCLTAAMAGAAYGTTITESPEPGGFGTELSTATVLPGLTIPGSNTVNGEVSCGDPCVRDAYFEFQFGTGLAGDVFSYALSANGTTGAKGGQFLVMDDLGNNIGNNTPFNFTAPAGSLTSITSGDAAVPTDGDVIFAVLQGSEGGGIQFSVNVTAPVAPEPGTSTEIGLGLAGAAVALRRRFKTRKA
jgi:hypothetical protein